MHIGERIRQERLRRRLSQEELAEALGISSKSISRWEKGLVSPQAHYRLQLSRFFAIAPELFFETNENEPDKSESVWHIPYPRNPHFTGRDELLDQLDRQFSPQKQDKSTITHRIALTQPQAIKGLGGIGKTQIAVEYAYRAYEQKRFTFIFWINAANAEALQTSFATLANVLPAFASKDEKDQHKLIAAIKRWLEQCQERWLLIYDNADDLSLVQNALPQRGNGCILLTTRAHAVGSLATSFDVEAMGLMEGTQLLLHRAQRLGANDEERNEAMNIVIALDGFPLALDQAGAYIEETGCGFSTYLQLYQSHRRALLARRGNQATNYPDSVATTWSLSFQRVEQVNPAAGEFLRLCAFLAPDHIPEELFKGGAPYWPPLLQQAAADLFAFNQMIEALLAFSLVRRFADKRILSLHRLVQIVQREFMTQEIQRQWAERIVKAVNAIFPSDPKEDIASWPRCLQYLEQAHMCYTLSQQYGFQFPEAAALLSRTGIYLHEHALYPIAEPLYQKALQIWEQQAESNHSHVAFSLNNLAELYRQQGKYEEAEPLYQRALYIREHHEGPDHLQVSTVLNNLAVLYHEQSRYKEAEPLYQRALYIREHHEGPDHLQLAYPLNNLAELYRQQGKYEEAEPLYQRALYIREHHEGPDHLQVTYPLANLATLYRQRGKYEQAEACYQRALHIREQQLGPDHPLVAMVLNSLGILHFEQRKGKEAEALYQRALQIWQQQLGPEHPIVVYPLNNLAELYIEQGRYQEAKPLYQQALRVGEQQLGPDHPEVATSLTRAAHLSSLQGEYEEAERSYRRALTIREHVLGQDHLDTADTLHDFAALQEAQGNLQQAISLYRRALAIREHVLGSEHPKTIETSTKYRELLDAMGQGESMDMKIVSAE